MMHPSKFALILAAAVVTSSAAAAQGTVSAQGAGYPPGELSTRSLATLGAIAETDGRSPINPASLTMRPVAQLFAQYDPEFRSVTANGQTSSTTTARFPNIGAIMPVNSRFVLGINASTLLDQTWATSRSITDSIANDNASLNESLKSEGAITDVRAAAGYALTSRLRIGLGLHAFVGSSRLTARTTFSDTLRYRNIAQITDLSYSGTAISGGFIADILPVLTIAASGQKGRTITMFAGDTVLSRGNIPDRYSGSVSFGGIPGTVLSLRGQREMWTQFAPLLTHGTAAVDATDVSAGVESAGPRIGGGFPILFRAGYRQRTLPFPVGTLSVTEKSFGGGFGIPIAFDRVTLDLAALRTMRSGVAGIDEHAYTLSFGLQVHP